MNFEKRHDTGFTVNPADFARKEARKSNSRYIRPPRWREIPDRLLKYRFAQDLAREVTPEKGMYVFCLLDGAFIAGDFVEAWMTEQQIVAKTLTISTLSMSENNVDSLANLMRAGYVGELNLIVSDYFFSHERRGLVPYIYQELDHANKFQMAVAGTHCKTILIETASGNKVVVHGSANLRSSSSLEHICIEENPPLYDFLFEAQSAILEKYKTINKSLRHEKLWQVVQK